MPKDGATVKLWASSRFASAPQKDTALPSGAATQSTTTGTTHGGNGQYRFTGVVTGTWYVSVEYNGSIVYDSFDVVAAPFVDVTDYGAVGDGVTDDSSAINTCLADTTGGIVYFPPGTYLVTGLTIPSRTGLVLEGQGASIKMSGTGSSGNPRGLTFSGTCRYITIRNLRFLGDGVAANYHAGVEVGTGLTIESLRIIECHFEDLCVGVWINSASGSMQTFLIDHCRFENMVGTGTTQGRGVYCSYSALIDLNLTIRDCDFDTCSLHAIQIAQAEWVTIRGNTFRNHRLATATIAAVPSVLIQNGTNFHLDGNTFSDYSDGGIGITPNSTTIKRVQITGNLFDSPANAVAAIEIGSTDPAANGTVENVSVSGNQLYQSGKTVQGLILWSALYATITNNIFQIESLSGTTYAFDLVGAGEAAGTSVYTDEVRLSGNTGIFTLSGGTGYGIRLRNDTAPAPDHIFATSNISAYFHDNSFPGAAANFSVSASVTGPSLVVLGMRQSGLTFATDRGPLRVDSGTIDWAGGQLLGYRAITATSTLTELDHIVACDVTAASITVNLPTAVGINGTVYTILKTDLSGNIVSIDPAGSETIDGVLAHRLMMEYESISIQAIAGNWRVAASTSRGYHRRTGYRHSAATPLDVTYEDDVLSVDSSGGAATINLPAIAGYQGFSVRIFRTSAANTVTIDPAGAETIDGAANYALPLVANNWVELLGDAAEWKKVAGRY